METNSNQENSARPQPAFDSTEDKRILEGRRSFFLWLIAVGTAAMGALLAVPLVRYVLYPVFARTTSVAWSNLGKGGQYSSLTAPVRQIVKIEQVDGWREAVSRKPVYVTRGKRKGSLDGVEVLSAVCPHLGCEVPWNAQEGKFMCPCHGSQFAPDGSLLQGPSLRGMDTLPVKSDQDDLMVRYEYFQALLPNKKEVG
ncbi:MAG TPA: ubiquinol-cytochrome c reductase iron-sulfur subunit [Terriglobia bacterium]|nr:ubiquinol-cytochrome c reductase iron-sulfur subunit [Terriglobia bacterium]